MTTSMLNATITAVTKVDQSSLDTALGYVALIISCIGFGTMFTPLKHKDAKDGVFVQWIECSVIMVCGFAINCARNFPKFQWIAGIGGVLYTAGNVFSMPIVGGIGMGLGLLIWGTMQILVGWGVARFGLFGWLSGSPVHTEWLNYVGVGITVFSGVLFVFVKHEDNQESTNSFDLTEKELEAESEENKTNNKTEVIKKIPYILMAVLLAIFNGLMMSPIDILKQKYPSDGHDRFQVFDYAFSFYSSAFVSSTLFFFAYVIIWRRKAHIERDLVLPSIGYGLLWTTGMTFWFFSSDKLSQVVAYPITTRLPAIISAGLEVFVYKSIRGARNLQILAVAVFFGLTGVVLIALSNVKL